MSLLPFELPDAVAAAGAHVVRDGDEAGDVFLFGGSVLQTKESRDVGVGKEGSIHIADTP